MRYDDVYERRARRAVEQGGIDVQTFLEDMFASGLSPDAVEERLLHDLETGGPIFGKFLRSLSGAAKSAVSAAERQGDYVATIRDDRALRRALDLTAIDDALDLADPEALEAIERTTADRMEWTWVAELVNTCPRCLPLHGESRTMAEWQELGLHPDTIHSGWDSTCHCMLVPTEMYEGARLNEPLVRQRVESVTGLKGSKRTQRAVAQIDLEKAQRAVESASKTLEGRRTLRLMGQVEAGYATEERT